MPSTFPPQDSPSSAPSTMHTSAYHLGSLHRRPFVPKNEAALRPPTTRRIHECACKIDLALQSEGGVASAPLPRSSLQFGNSPTQTLILGVLAFFFFFTLWITLIGLLDGNTRVEGASHPFAAYSSQPPVLIEDKAEVSAVTGSMRCASEGPGTQTPNHTDSVRLCAKARDYAQTFTLSVSVCLFLFPLVTLFCLPAKSRFPRARLDSASGVLRAARGVCKSWR
jgi:hypothetical protein